MRYLIQAPRITKGITKTGRYAGQPYFLFQADLFIEDDPFANPNRLPRFYTLNENVARLYMPAGTLNQQESQNGVEVYDIDVNKIEEKYRHINNVFPFRKELARPYGRLQAGSTAFVVARNGSVTPVTAITVYGTKRQDNEQVGQWEWVEDMDQVVNRILERNYKPLDDSPIAPAATMPQQAPEEAAATAQQRIANIMAGINAAPQQQPAQATVQGVTVQQPTAQPTAQPQPTAAMPY